MKQILFLLSSFGIAPLALLASESISEPAMSNLQSAFNGESNAHARYLAFAEKADAEGYRGAASLFRAAARAEEIHAGNHAAVIKQFGGAPEAKLEESAVKSTRENLEAALKGETYERDEMYPDFIRQAEMEENADALRTFRFALAAEVEHAKLYAAALEDLETMKTSRVFYVCPVCGFTTPNLDFEGCPTCATPKETFRAGELRRAIMLTLPPIPNWQAIHPLIVHFPIALLLIAPLFIVIGAALEPERRFPFLLVALILMALGTRATFVAASSGEAAGELAENVPQAKAVLDQHEELAEITANRFRRSL